MEIQQSTTSPTPAALPSNAEKEPFTALPSLPRPPPIFMLQEQDKELHLSPTSIIDEDPMLCSTPPPLVDDESASSRASSPSASSSASVSTTSASVSNTGDFVAAPEEPGKQQQPREEDEREEAIDPTAAATPLDRRVKRGPVRFYEVVIVGYTHAKTEYDRTSTAVEPLTPLDVQDLIDMRAEMKHTTDELYRMRALAFGPPHPLPPSIEHFGVLAAAPQPPMLYPADAPMPPLHHRRFHPAPPPPAPWGTPVPPLSFGHHPAGYEFAYPRPGSPTSPTMDPSVVMSVVDSVLHASTSPVMQPQAPLFGEMDEYGGLGYNSRGFATQQQHYVPPPPGFARQSGTTPSWTGMVLPIAPPPKAGLVHGRRGSSGPAAGAGAGRLPPTFPNLSFMGPGPNRQPGGPPAQQRRASAPGAQLGFDGYGGFGYGGLPAMQQAPRHPSASQGRYGAVATTAAHPPPPQQPRQPRQGHHYGGRGSTNVYFG
ncbi:hypothetical protein HDU96_007399 [Phlyctochytrium bullatum]|nr:hypothetical protein HDU96_007399 [Phlyctochytrium bullatum]